MARNVTKEIGSPLRYPGGKSRFLQEIIPNIYPHYREFREPFVGGGSVFLAAMQKINPKAVYRINYLNYDLYCSWKELKENADALIESISGIKHELSDGKQLFRVLTSKARASLERYSHFICPFSKQASPLPRIRLRNYVQQKNKTFEVR